MVNIAASSGKIWTAFCDAPGAAALKAKPEYQDGKSRAARREQLDADINALTADLRFATPGSRFGIPAARLGLGDDHPGLAPRPVRTRCG